MPKPGDSKAVCHHAAAVGWQGNHYRKDMDRTQAFDANSEYEYCNAPAARECEDFSLVRDLADML